MSKTQQEFDRCDTNREGSKLENDTMFHCKECGISLSWKIVIIGEFERCRKCEKEAMLEEFRREFPREWDDLNPQEVVSAENIEESDK